MRPKLSSGTSAVRAFCGKLTSSFPFLIRLNPGKAGLPDLASLTE